MAPTKGPPALREHLTEAVRRLGTKRALAATIGITEGRVGRVMLGEGSMEIPNLLRLAEVVDAQPSEVLRAGGKPDEAALIERLYGIGRAPLSTSQRQLLELWEQMPENGRRHFMALMRDVIGDRTLETLPAYTQLKAREKRRIG